MKLLLIASLLAFTAHAQAMDYANETDKKAAGKYEQREKDWRNGALVYQVLPDRFAPPADLDKKRPLYPAPKQLRTWDQTPQRGVYLEDAKLWSHEIEFWGGDLQSLRGKLDYVQQLGAEVLYLNPIHLAYTNHKYDAFDYAAISPEFGTRDDFKALAADVKQRGMKLVLDGVFNHMGRQGPKFQDALKNPKSPWRDWFYFGKQYPGGARSWWLAENLPEINLENPAVRAHVYGDANSVVRQYLRDGADGWRLDVAVDIGFKFLGELTRAAHAEKPGSLVVGEIANYPSEWFPSVDGVMNFTLRAVILRLVQGQIDAPQAARMIDRMVRDSGTDNLLKSWLMLDNHDEQRIATRIPDETQRRLAQVLQFTLPGAPNLYYGSELGMTGGGDPEMRAPMRWDWVTQDNRTLAWTKQLIALRKAQRALRVGDFRLAESQKLLAFERYTDRAAETVVLVMNPTQQVVRETVLVANAKLMNNWMLVDQLGGGPKQQIVTGLLDLELPPGAFRVYVPELSPGGGYSAYKRVQ